VDAARRRSGEEEIAAWGVGNFGRWRRGALFKGGRWEEESEGGRATWSMRGGSGARAGGSLPTGERCPAGSSLKPVGAHDMRHARAAGQTEGEGRG
jgi:hypothetical protein